MKKLNFLKTILAISIIAFFGACSSDDNTPITPDVNNNPNYGFGVTYDNTPLSFTDNTCHYNNLPVNFFGGNPVWALNGVIRFSNTSTRIDNCTTHGYIYDGNLANETQTLQLFLYSSKNEFNNNDISDFYTGKDYYDQSTLQVNNKIVKAILSYKNSSNVAVIKYNKVNSTTINDGITLEKIDNFKYKVSGKINFENGTSISIPTGTIADFDCISPQVENQLPVTQANIVGKWQESFYKIGNEVNNRYLYDYFVPCYQNNNIFYEFTTNGVLTRQQYSQKYNVEKIVNNLNQFPISNIADGKKFIFNNDIYVWYNNENKNPTILTDWIKMTPVVNEECIVRTTNGTFLSGTYKFNGSSWTRINSTDNAPFVCNTTITSFISSYSLNINQTGNFLSVTAFSPNLLNPSLSNLQEIISLTSTEMKIKYTISGITYIVGYKKL